MTQEKVKSYFRLHSIEPGEAGWQAHKSAITRNRILGAVIDCVIAEGYSKLTTTKVATSAGVSRGAMLHHFPSKADLVRATVGYLHDRLLEDFSARINKIPNKLKGADRRRAGLDMYWEHLTGDLFTSYHELCVAGRTDPELRVILEASLIVFEENVIQINTEFFSEWSDRGDLFLLAMDVTKFMMEGMAINQMTTYRSKRVDKMIDYLADRLEEIFEAGGNSAISVHS